MRSLARLLRAALVFVFAAGTVVQATAATGTQTDAPMSMTMPGPASDPMPGGDDCSEEWLQGPPYHARFVPQTGLGYSESASAMLAATSAITSSDP